MTQSTHSLPRGLEELVTSCWVLKRNTHFSYHKKLQIKLLLLADTKIVSRDEPAWFVARSCQFHCPWDRHTPVMMPLNLPRANDSRLYTEEKGLSWHLPFCLWVKTASPRLFSPVSSVVIHPRLAVWWGGMEQLVTCMTYRSFRSLPISVVAWEREAHIGQESS